jgi:gliding motility-associated-like protein
MKIKVVFYKSLVIFAFIFHSFTGYSIDYFVDDNSNDNDRFTIGSTNGDDANDGSSLNPFATIAHALSIAISGDRIFIDAGIYNETNLHLEVDDIQIIGAGNNLTFFNHLHLSEAYFIYIAASNIVVQDLTISGYSNQGNLLPIGSAQALTIGDGTNPYSSIQINNIIFSNNANFNGYATIRINAFTTTTFSGGGVFCTNGSIASNVGAISYNGENINSTATDFIFANNTKSPLFNGGAVSINTNNNSTINFTNVLFESNSAGNGGAIYQSGSNLTITNSLFKWNRAGYQLSPENFGGSIFIEAGITSISNSRFEYGSFNPLSKLKGGAIAVIPNNNDVNLTVNNCLFVGNLAEMGTDIFVNPSSANEYNITVDETTFSNSDNALVENENSSITCEGSDFSVSNSGNPSTFSSNNGGGTSCGINFVNTNNPATTPFVNTPNFSGNCPSISVCSILAPTAASTQTFNYCSNSSLTLADLSVTGTAIKWYDSETGGNELPSTTLLSYQNTYYASQTDGTPACESIERVSIKVTNSEVRFGDFASAVQINNGSSTLFNTTSPGIGDDDEINPFGPYLMNNFLGVFNPNSEGLRITGAEIKTYMNGGNVCNDSKIHYRTFKQGSVPGDFISLALSELVTCGSTNDANEFADFLGPCNGNDRKWKNYGLNEDLTAQNCVGDYILEIFYTYEGSNCNTSSCDEKKTILSSTGDYFRATFSINNISPPSSNLGTFSPSFCKIEYRTLEDLLIEGTGTINYYRNDNGVISSFVANDTLTTGNYIITQSGFGCESTESLVFNVTINDEVPPTGEANQSFCSVNNSTLNDLEIIGTAIKWYATNDPSDVTVLDPATPLIDGTTYFASQTTFCESTERLGVTVTIINNPLVDALSSVTECDLYSLPALTNGNYFTLSGGNGTALSFEDEINSTQTIFVYNETVTNPNCTAESSFTITINNTPLVDSPSDVTRCDSYVLPSLTNGNYFTASGGTGTPLFAGNTITSTQTIFVYNETATSPNCTSESSFTVTINNTPLVDSPSDVTRCDSYVLPALTNGNYFTASGGTGIPLSAGSTINSTQTIFVYNETATTPNCIAESSFTVTINNTPLVDSPSDVTRCDSYVLPALTNGNYFTGSGGTGTPLFAGNTITSTQTIFVYNETGTTPNCTAESSFTVTINNTPLVDSPSDVTRCDSYVLPTLTNGNYFTASGGTGTPFFAGNTITSTQTIFVYNETGTNPNCTAESSFTITINNTPLVDSPSDVTRCDSYVLPSLTNGNYFTASGGTGTPLFAGSTINSTQTIFVYNETATTPNCTAESSFTITINNTPLVDSPSDVTRCDSYVLPSLTNGNYFTGSGGTGTPLFAGSTITSTQTIFVYNETATNPNCTAESSFTVTINNTPLVDNPSNVTSCDNFILPNLTNGSYFTGTNGTGTLLNAGDTLNATQTVYVYAQTGTNPNCFAENSFIITIPVINPPNATQEQLFCSSDELTINDLEVQGNNITWYSQAVGGELLPTSTILIDGVSYFASQTVNSCESSIRTMVTVNLNAIALSVNEVIQPTCGQLEGLISVSASGGEAPYQYAWSNGSEEATISGLSSGIYTVKVTENSGCTQTITYNLACVFPDIPEIITPSGNGKNETWVIGFGAQYTEMTLSIFNRWGNEVFKASPYLDDWDGKSNVGSMMGNEYLPNGTYFYIIDLKDGSKPLSGYIELVR